MADPVELVIDLKRMSPRIDSVMASVIRPGRFWAGTMTDGTAVLLPLLATPHPYLPVGKLKYWPLASY